MSNTKLTAKQQQLLHHIKARLELGLAIELFPAGLVGFDTNERALRALEAKGAIRLVNKDQSSYASCRTYGPCLSVEVVS